MDRRPGSSRVICSTRQPGIGQSLFMLRSMGSDASPSKPQHRPAQSTQTAGEPFGCAEINDFDPGDIWYFPRGHPHSLACLGDQPCHFILIFDNGYFSEFGTFSITDWLGHASQDLLAKNFGLPAATFDGFPTEEAYFVQGSAPPEDVTPLQGALDS